MSAARVINPVINELCKIGSSPSMLHSKLPCGQHLSRVKKDLFGAANPVEINKIFNEEMDKHYEQAANKWGFDFRKGVPLNVNTQYNWERVSGQESVFAPQMYTLTRAAHIPNQEAQPITIDLLMDERAERENIINLTTDSSDESHDEDISVIFKLPALPNQHQQHQQQQQKHTTLPTCTMQLRKRQPKITEYMKERKRLAPVPKKLSPTKRMRLTTGGVGVGGGSGGSPAATCSSAHNSHTVNNNSISFHFSLRSSQRHN